MDNRLRTTPATKVSQYTYAYNKSGNRKSMATLTGTHAYTYDRLYQLTKAAYPSGYPFYATTFNYDALGNRSSTVSGSTTSYTSNSLNQYTKTGAKANAYDLSGNLTSDASFTYTYDYENRLTGASKSGTTAGYTYDPFGRRISKTVNGKVNTFLYDGDQVIAEYTSSNNLITKFVYGPGIDEVVKGLSSKGTVPEWFYHYDGLGSVTNLTNSSGTIIESYSYDVFGKPLIKNQAGAIISSSSLGNRYLFTGREFDSETGLYHYRARAYSPALGRFLQRDPIGYSGGMNLYSYVENNSVNWIDPLGLDSYFINYQLIDDRHLPTNEYLSHTYLALTDNGVVTDTISWGNGGKGRWFHNDPQDMKIAQEAISSRKGSQWQGNESLDYFVLAEFNKVKSSVSDYFLFSNDCKENAIKLMRKAKEAKKAEENERRCTK